MYRSTNLSNIRLLSSRGTLLPKLKTHIPVNKCGKSKSFTRSFSSPAKKSAGSGAYVAGTFAVVGLLGGGSAVYAKYDDAFRKNIEEVLPFVKPVLDTLYGDVGVSKSQSSLIEKDLSIPFTPYEQEKVPEEEAPAPLFADNIPEGKDTSSDVVAINVLDSPAVSQLDLDISNMGTRKKQKGDTVPASAAEKTAVVKDDDSSSSSGVVAISVLDSPAVSHIDLDISNMGANKKQKEVNKIEPNESGKAQLESPTTSSELSDYVIVESETGATLHEGRLKEGETLSSGGAINQIQDTPLTKEEIKNLSGVLDQAALEVVLDSTKEYIALQFDDVVKAQKEAVDSVRSYIKHYINWIAGFKSEDRESLQTKLSEIESSSQTLIDNAVSKEAQLKEEFENFKELISSVKQLGVSEIADTAENLVSSCSAKLNDAVSALNRVNKELGFISKVEKVIKGFPENIQKSVKRFTPDLFETVESFSEEIDVEALKPEEALIGFVLKRSEQLKSALNDVSQVSVKKMEEVLEQQKETFLKETEEKLAEELKRVEAENLVAQEKKIKELQEDYEKEILAQLKRQASAHNEHLMDELTTQASLLNSKHKKEMSTKVDELRVINQLKLEKNLACIQGIQSKIAEVVDADKKQRRVQELWVAAQALNSGLKEALVHGRTRTLMPELMSVLHLSGHNAVIEEIVASFPQDAASIGVVPEKELLLRFKDVKSACKKVAMVGEQGGAVPTYLLSYLKSFFMFSFWYKGSFESDVDVDNLDPYEILAKAEYYALEGDLEQVAKFMSQLKGVPRKLCSDWLKETRLLLETKQTASLLMTYAASLNVGYE